MIGPMMTQASITRRSFLTGAAALVAAAALAPFASEEAQAAKKRKAAVIYFSCTGTTAGAAKRIAKYAGCKAIAIKAADPYSEDDIDYGDSKSRVCKEHRGASTPAESSVRPEIKNLAAIKKAVKSANVVFIGYPIWWGEAPHILYTLIENVPLKGKKVVPFCTSAASGKGSSDKHLKSCALRKATWKKGRNFYDVPSQKTVNKWVKGLKVL